jgi:hypothetical protein
MKNKNLYQYSEISNFEDFRLEKERLMLKRKLIETSISLRYLHFREMFSVSNLLFSSAKEFIIAKISDLLDGLTKKVENDVN